MFVDFTQVVVLLIGVHVFRTLVMPQSRKNVRSLQKSASMLERLVFSLVPFWLVVGCQLLVVGCWLLTVGCWLRVDR